MVTIYTTNSCASCRKAKEWFKTYNIPFKEKNFFTSPLTKEDLKYILTNTENGFDDIISTRSKIILEQKIDIDSMKVSDLLDFIIKNPSILKRPIIVDDAKMQVGYNEDEIRTFIPSEMRKQIKCSDCKTEDCDYKKLFNQQLQIISKDLKEEK